MDVLRTYRELLRNGPLARLLIGEFVSSIGDWLYLVALVVLVYRETEDPIILGIVGALRMLPYIFLSIPAGIITDRFDRRYVLLVSDLARAACMVVLAILVASDGPLWAITRRRDARRVLLDVLLPGDRRAASEPRPRRARVRPREQRVGDARQLRLDRRARDRRPAARRRATSALAFALNAVSFLLIAVILWTLPASKPTPAARSPTTTPTRNGDEARPRSTTSGRPASSSARSAGSPSSRRSPGSCSAASASSSSSSRPTCSTAATPRPGYLNGAIGIGGTIGALLAGALVLRPRLGRPLMLGALAFGAATLLLGVANSLLAAFIAITVAVGRQPRHGRHRHDDLPARGPRRVPRPVRRRDDDRPGDRRDPGHADRADPRHAVRVRRHVRGPRGARGRGDGPRGGDDRRRRRPRPQPVRHATSSASPACRCSAACRRRASRRALRRLDPLEAVGGRRHRPPGRHRGPVLRDLRRDVPGDPGRAADGTERVLRTLGQDDVFGERGLLARSPRTRARSPPRPAAACSRCRARTSSS